MWSVPRAPDSSIRDLNKTEIRALDKTIKLSREGNIDFYAFEIGENHYILFSFLPKKRMLLMDVMELIDGDNLKFLVYSKHIPSQEVEQ